MHEFMSRRSRVSSEFFSVLWPTSPCWPSRSDCGCVETGMVLLETRRRRPVLLGERRLTTGEAEQLMESCQLEHAFTHCSAASGSPKVVLHWAVQSLMSLSSSKSPNGQSPGHVGSTSSWATTKTFAMRSRVSERSFECIFELSAVSACVDVCESRMSGSTSFCMNGAHTGV